MLNRKKTIAGRSLKRKNDLKEQLSLLLLLLPGVILLFMFNYLPMGGAIIAFKDFNPNLGIMGSPWNGFKNFEYFFTFIIILMTEYIIFYTRYISGCDK